MHKRSMRMASAIAALLLSFTLNGCDRQEAAAEARAPVEITRGDECHVCGMIVADFPGPKGEVFVAGQARPLMFCSTADLFAYLLQPEAGAVAQEVYVHDMGSADWAHPTAAAFIDARTAWYVAGRARTGAMGPTLASFKQREAAQAFSAEHGGEVLAFEQITLELLTGLAQSHNAHGHAH